MLNLKVKHPKAKVAIEFEAGELFEDQDGDLYLRCTCGAIRFEGPELIIYSDEDCAGGEKFSYLNECYFVEGDVNFKVKLK
jgi:hypothetical protein